MSLSAAAADLTGKWRIDLWVGSSASMPIVGASEITSRTVMLAEVEPTETGLVQRHRVCAVSADANRSVITTAFPEAFVNALQPKEYPVSLSENGDYFVDFGDQFIGYDEVLSQGRMPTSMDDASLIDFEGDGVLAATVELDVPLLSNAKIYLVQHTHTQLRGEVVDANQVAGRAEVLVMDQYVLDGDPSIFARNPVVQQAPERHRFLMQRVPLSFTCAEIREMP